MWSACVNCNSWSYNITTKSPDQVGLIKLKIAHVSFIACMKILRAPAWNAGITVINSYIYYIYFQYCYSKLKVWRYYLFQLKLQTSLTILWWIVSSESLPNDCGTWRRTLPGISTELPMGRNGAGEMTRLSTHQNNYVMSQDKLWLQPWIYLVYLLRKEKG